MTEPFDHWALVEIMGHRRFAGRVTEQVIAGTSFIHDEPTLEAAKAWVEQREAEIPF